MVELRAALTNRTTSTGPSSLRKRAVPCSYGFDDYKVHSKLTLITSKVDGKYHYLTQIGTGNYNEKTSEQYTDLSFITSARRSARRPAPCSTIWRCSA